MKNKLFDNPYKRESSNSDEDNRRVRTINIVLSIVMAIILWAYVIGEVNPETEKLVTGVPLTVVGENALTSHNMVVLTKFDEEISAVIKGKRNNLYNITASNISAYLDISKCVEGENQVAIDVIAPNKVTEAFPREDSVTVIVDKLIEEPRDVNIVINGKFNDKTDVEIKSINVETVNVLGPGTYVAEVDSVAGILNVNESKNSYDETVSLLPVDKYGNTVKDVKLATSSVNVKAERTLISSVTVPIEITGGNDEEYTYDYPKSVDVTLKGNYDDVKEIKSLETLPLNLYGITEDTSLILEVRIPDGVNAVDDAGKQIQGKNENHIEIKVDIKVEKKNPIKEE